MVGFFKLFILVLLILVEIVTIDKIFDTVKIKVTDNNYKKKLFLKNIVELLILLVFIFILVFKYLEYYSVNTKDAVNVSLIICFLVLVVFLFQNKKELDTLLTDGFSNIEGFKQCPNNEENIPFLDEKHIFSLVPAKYRDMLSEDDRYKIACKYPFYIADNIHLKTDSSKLDLEKSKIDISDYITILEEPEFEEHEKFPNPGLVKYNTDQAKLFF